VAEKAPSIEDRLNAVLNPVPEKAAEAPPAAPAPEAEADYQPVTAGALEGDETPPPAPAAEGDEPAGWMPERLEDIAEAGGWDIADLYKIKIKVNGPDGKPAEVSLGEWKDAYQQSSQLDAVRRSEREAHERAEQTRQQALEDLARKTVEINGLTDAAMQQLLTKYQSVNWDQLRALDPAEWAARRAEMQEEYGRLQGIRQQALNTAQAQMQQQQAEQAESYQKYLREQADQIKTLVPEFGDPEKVSEVQRATVQWMKSHGYSDFEVGMVSHSARLVKLVRDQINAGNTEAKKIPVAPKKFLRPGVAQQRGSKEAEAYKSARSKLRKSGKLDDATAVFKRILGG